MRAGLFRYSPDPDWGQSNRKCFAAHPPFKAPRRLLSSPSCGLLQSSASPLIQRHETVDSRFDSLRYVQRQSQVVYHLACCLPVIGLANLRWAIARCPQSLKLASRYTSNTGRFASTHGSSQEKEKRAVGTCPRPAPANEQQRELAICRGSSQASGMHRHEIHPCGERKLNDVCQKRPAKPSGQVESCGCE